jgi:hypothetical protein
MFYKLVGKLVVPAGNEVEDWIQASGDDVGRRVAQDTIEGAFVSTVFLSIDHSFGDDDDPMLFETMIFPIEVWDCYQTRCSTWDQAIEMHAIACAYVRHRLRLLPVVIECES